MNVLASDAKKRAALAIFGLAVAAIRIFASMIAVDAALCSSGIPSSAKRRSCGTRLMQLTRMWRCLSSLVHVRAKDLTAAWLLNRRSCPGCPGRLQRKR